MGKLRRRQIGLLPLFLILVAGLNLQGCFSVKLVSDYDEQTDTEVTELYRGIMDYMTGLQTRPQVTGKDSIARADDYNQVSLDIGVLKLRASAKDKNEQQIQQVELLADSWKKIGELQKLNLPAQAIENARSGMETTLTAILKLEEAKKRP